MQSFDGRTIKGARHSTEQLAKDTTDRFDKNEGLIYAVLFIVSITLVGIVVAG